MLTIAYLLLAILISLVIPLYIVRVIRGRSTSSRVLFAYTAAIQVFFGSAAILYIPTTEQWIAQLTGITTLSLWLSNMGSLLSTYFCVCFFQRILTGRDPATRLFTSILVGVMVAMTLALVLAGPQVASNGQPLTQVVPLLVVYRVLDILFLGTCEAWLVLLWRAQLRVIRDLALRIGYTFFSLGGYLSSVWLILNIPLAVTPVTSPASVPLNAWYGSVFTVMGICFMLGSIIPLLGMRTSAVGSPWRAIAAYYRLYPLWKDLTAATPQVVLPLTFQMRDAIWKSADLDLLLYRRVIEILDAWRRLTITSGALNASLGGETALETTSAARMHADAQMIRSVLQGEPPPVPSAWHLPARYKEQVWYLAALSQAYQRLKPRSTSPSPVVASIEVKGSAE